MLLLLLLLLWICMFCASYFCQVSFIFFISGSATSKYIHKSEERNGVEIFLNAWQIFFRFSHFVVIPLNMRKTSTQNCSVNLVSVINRNKFMQKSEHREVTMGLVKFLYTKIVQLFQFLVLKICIKKKLHYVINIILFDHKICEFISLCYKYLKRNWHFKVWFEHISNYKSCFIFIAFFIQKYAVHK